MKKPTINPALYAAWDDLKEKLTVYDREEKEYIKYFKKHKTLTTYMALFSPKEPGLKDAMPLLRELSSLPREYTGRNRKKEEELVLIPRGILAYIVNKASMGFPYEKKLTIPENVRDEDVKE